MQPRRREGLQRNRRLPQPRVTMHGGVLGPHSDAHERRCREDHSSRRPRHRRITAPRAAAGPRPPRVGSLMRLRLGALTRRVALDVSNPRVDEGKGQAASVATSRDHHGAMKEATLDGMQRRTRPRNFGSLSDARRRRPLNERVRGVRHAPLSSDPVTHHAPGSAEQDVVPTPTWAARHRRKGSGARGGHDTGLETSNVGRTNGEGTFPDETVHAMDGLCLRLDGEQRLHPCPTATPHLDGGRGICEQ